MFMARIFVPLLFTLILGTACVPKGAHNNVLTSNIELSSKVAAINQERDQLKEELDRMKTKLSDLEIRNEELSNTNQLLVGKNKDYALSSLDTQQKLLKLKDERNKTEDKVAYITKTYDDLVKTLQHEISEGQVRIAQQGNRLSVNMSDQILFPSGQASIQKKGRSVLRKVVGVLKKVKGKRIMVEGHTDNVPIRGPLRAKFDSNWELSTARATKVVRFMQQQGISPKKLTAVGYGPYRPVASNDSAASRKLNRRIEIVLAPLPTGINP